MDEKEKRLSDYDQSGQLWIVEMVGAFIRMIFNGFKKDYQFYYQVTYQKRNLWIGYISYILFIFLIVFLSVFFLSHK